MKPAEWTARVRAGTDGPAHVLARNHNLLSDSPLGIGLRDDHPSSLDLLLSALGSDLVLRLQAGLRRTGLEVESLELKLRAELEDPLVALDVRGAEGSPALARIAGVFYLTGFFAVADTPLLEEAWRRVQQTSPVLQTLRRACPVTIELKQL